GAIENNRSRSFRGRVTTLRSQRSCNTVSTYRCICGVTCSVPGSSETRNQRFSVQGHRILPVKVVFELRCWDQPDLAVQTAVIEPVHVLGHRDLDLVQPLPGPAVTDQLDLEQRIERLSQSIVIGIAGG